MVVVNNRKAQKLLEPLGYKADKKIQFIFLSPYVYLRQIGHSFKEIKVLWYGMFDILKAFGGVSSAIITFFILFIKIFFQMLCSLLCFSIIYTKDNLAEGGVVVDANFRKPIIDSKQL